MEDLAVLLESHSCAGGQCSRRTHTQLVRVDPADVATPTAELRMLTAVRDCLTAHNLRMLETVPPPRWNAADGDTDEPRPWPVRYDEAWAALPRTSPGAAAAGPPPSLWSQLRGALFGHRRPSP